ncbi:MAG: 16S rRNA processing protein RimM [Alphaproteobacteria bacterium]|nr:16S rRNA processing protein RimM [Alphaproteobacteria bacterium]
MSRSQYVHHRRAEPDIDPKWIAVGVIVGALGVKGAVRFKSFSDDLPAVFDRGPVRIFPDRHSTGEQRDAEVMHRIKIGYACQISGVSSRDDAEGLKGVKLYVAREELPEITEDGSYYHDDMTGLIATDTAGQPFGVVAAIYNFGAGDLLEVRLNDSPQNPAADLKIYPFRDEFVPEVNIDGGFVIIDRVAFGDIQEPS